LLRSRTDPDSDDNRDSWCDGDSDRDNNCDRNCEYECDCGWGDADGKRDAGRSWHCGAGAAVAGGGRGLSDRGEYRRE
jgi:hypothetical protein